VTLRDDGCGNLALEDGSQGALIRLKSIWGVQHQRSGVACKPSRRANYEALSESKAK